MFIRLSPPNIAERPVMDASVYVYEDDIGIMIPFPKIYTGGITSLFAPFKTEVQYSSVSRPICHAHKTMKYIFSCCNINRFGSVGCVRLLLSLFLFGYSIQEEKKYFPSFNITFNFLK